METLPTYRLSLHWSAYQVANPTSNASYALQFLRSITSLMRFPWICPIPSGKKTISPINVSDVCGIIQSSIDSELNYSGTIVEVAGKTAYNVDQLFKLVSSKFGRGSRIQIRGVVGNALVGILEKSKKQSNLPGIRDYLELSAVVNENKNTKHPIVEKFLNLNSSFSELLHE